MEWTLTKESSYKAGFQKMIKRHFLLPSGVEMEYDLVDMGNSAIIIAVTKDMKFIMERVFRPGPNKIMYEFPSGFIDGAEKPLEAARRELLEETGYSGEFSQLGDIYTGAYSTEIREIFLATDCILLSEPSTSEEDEDHEILLLSPEEVMSVLLNAKCTATAEGLIALKYLGFY